MLVRFRVRTLLLCSSKRFASSSSAAFSANAKAKRAPGKYTDEELCIPSKPTWSLNALFQQTGSTASAANARELSDEKLDKLCRLAALQAPATADGRARLKADLRELIGLVDAVRAVDTSSVATTDDGALRATVWPTDESIRLHEEEGEGREDGGDGGRSAGTTKRALDEMHVDGTETMDREQLMSLARRKMRDTYVVNRPQKNEVGEGEGT